MVEKVFRSFDDIGFDALIGGSLRLARQRVPPAIQGLAGLVNPADPDHVRTFWEETARKDLVIEIGPGKGAFLCAMAARRPGLIFVGFEVRLAFCVRTLQRAAGAGLSNVRLAWGDARATLPHLVRPGTVREAYLLYPDPWWKRRQASRRYGPLLTGLVAKVLAKGGIVVLKSDVMDYLAQLQAAFLDTGHFDTFPVPQDLPETNREKKIIKKGGKGFAAALIKR